MHHKSITIVLVGVILIFPLLCLSSSTEKQIESHNIVLHYSNVIPDDIAKEFLAEQESRLRFVQMFLGIRIDRKISIHLLGTLSRSAAWADTRKSTIEYMVPIESFLQPDFQGIRDVSACHHELVHVIAGLGWPGIPSDALCEGLAVYVDFSWPSSCARDIYAITQELIETDKLLSLKDLLSHNITSETSRQEMENVYFSSATFIEFIIEIYGLNKLEQFYGISGLPYVLIDSKTVEIFGVTLTKLEAEWLGFMDHQVAIRGL